MKLMASLSFSLVFASLLASGQALTKEAKIERLLALTQADTIMDQVFSQMKSMTTSFMPTGTTTEQRAKAQQTQEKILDLLKSRISWDKMRAQYVSLYSETFSDEEIDGMLAFYQSPAGRAMLDKTPVLMAKTMALVQSQMTDIMPEIQRISREATQK